MAHFSTFLYQNEAPAAKNRDLKPKFIYDLGSVLNPSFLQSKNLRLSAELTKKRKRSDYLLEKWLR
jgi:hypothetical protein